MNIAILADETKKELLLQFCIRNHVLLSKHRLISTTGVSKYIAKNTKLLFEISAIDIYEGMDIITSKIAYNEVDLLIYFKNNDAVSSPEAVDLIRMCDIHNIPYATNLSTADLILKCLSLGYIQVRNHKQIFNQEI